jgi:hypothetical protein
MNRRIIDYLQSVEISHSFAMKYNHGVQSINSNGRWDLFEPTRFVYSFFALNMIYSIDWPRTIDSNSLKYHNYRSGKTAQVQIGEVIDFIHSNSSTLFQERLLKFDSNRELFSAVVQMDIDYNSSKKSLRDGKNTIAQDFMRASKKFTDCINLDADDHFDLMQMSYTVRNNLFHGEKKAYQMREKGHRNRLLHYGNIILATNESFFETLKNKFNYRRIENYEIQDNL